MLYRANYAYGMLRAADMALLLGKRGVTVCEFGVASGSGLLNMLDLAAAITSETGVQFRVVGFDTGRGLPDVGDYRDHPEAWATGDFPMGDVEQLRRTVAKRGGELILGDIGETIDSFMETLVPEFPLGFVSIDVDIYSATKSAFRCFGGRPELYCPVVSIYFDDIVGYFANEWCGELLAIREFNEEGSSLRKIDHDRSLPGDRPMRDADFYKHMYACHILDHELRNRHEHRSGLTLEEHVEYMKSRALV